MNEQGLTWWRVEIDKDGGIKTVTEVEEASKGNKLVCFVQATTRADACVRAKKWWEARKARTRSRNERVSVARIGEGLCTRCGIKRARKERRTCANCGAIGSAASLRSQARARGEDVPLLRDNCLDPQEAKRRANAATARYMAQGPRMTAVAALRRFDTLGPKKFRAWLVGIIEAAKAKAEPVAEAAE